MLQINEPLLPRNKANKIMKIIINTHEIEKDEMTITYQEVCFLALGDGYNGNNVYTVAWFRPNNKDRKESGSLVKNEEVLLDDGMIFNVALTNNG